MKKYKVIYADPPWSFRNWSKKAKKNVNEHYDVMSIKDIQSLPVSNICSDDCVLLLWVTFPLLPQGLETMKSWGFEYKTNAFTWVKMNKKSVDTLFWGCGYYTRSNSEICLLGTRGKVLERVSHSVHSVIQSPVQEHSRKPTEARDRIVELFGNVPRVELFSRQEVEGWDCFGNGIDGCLC